MLNTDISGLSRLQPTIIMYILVKCMTLASRDPNRSHDDVIKWKHFPRYWPFVWGIHWSPVNSPHKGHWRGALMFALICARINAWVNTAKAGDLRHHRAHYSVNVMNFYYADNSQFSIGNSTCSTGKSTLSTVCSGYQVKDFSVSIA